MAIKLNKDESMFRNELIFAADAKAVNIENTLLNLFMLLNHNGTRPKQHITASNIKEYDLESLKKIFSGLDEDGSVRGFRDYPEAAELWLRSNLVNMVFRGKADKEKISSLRPIHSESYRIRNAKNARDYNTADQVYTMLGANTNVKDKLREFLQDGWDKTTNKITSGAKLDVDSLGILHLITNKKVGFPESQNNVNLIRPLLKKQSELFCDDVRRLLVYKGSIPRNVLIDYLKTIISFHLSIYLQKLIHTLPEMVKKGTTDVADEWSIVVDVTDNMESKISSLAVKDAEALFNRLNDYIKATFQINAALMKLKLSRKDSSFVNSALHSIHLRESKFEDFFEAYWSNLYGNIKDEDDQRMVDDFVKYEETYFDKYVELIMQIRGGYQQKFHVQIIDNLSQKNNERGFMAQGRSRKHPRRFVLGTRLLEALVQIMVLKVENDSFSTHSLSIEELLSGLRQRYGLIINGLSEERFKDADLSTHLAFKENTEAFKNKLRQIGFYNMLSDAYILQKVRPRYTIKN